MRLHPFMSVRPLGRILLATFFLGIILGAIHRCGLNPRWISAADKPAAVPAVPGNGAGSGKAATANPVKESREKATIEETWQVVYIGEARVGFGRTTTETKTHSDREIIVSDTELSLAITRFGQVLKSKTLMQTTETLDGDLLSFHFEMLNPPAAPTRKSGQIEKDKLMIETELAGKVTRSEMPWDRSLKAPGYQDRLLRDNPLKKGEKRTIRSFDPQFGKVNVVTLEEKGQEEAALLGGEKQLLQRVSVTSSVAPTMVLDEFLNPAGEALVTRMSLLGMTMYKVSREEALKSLSGAEVDLAVGTLVKVRKIDRPQQTSRVVYRLTIPGEDPARILAVGPTQKVTSIDASTVDLTVTAVLPPASTPPDAKPVAREYLTPNEYLQSDNELVIKLAREGAGDETDSWEICRRLERWVYQNLKRKNFSTLLASAAEVARDLQGDCTEHAVLLSAMARAKGIPARVAVGLVYVDSLQSFGGHMWSEVHVNGTWIPLDATLGHGGIGADHIKFADSSFSDMDPVSPLSTFLPLVTVLGKLQVDVREVKHRD